MITIPYPASPKVDAEKFTEVSPRYKTQVIKVLFSIILFIASYLFIFALALVVFALALLAAGAILGAIRHWLGILIVLGVLLTAGMFFFFIVKFLFQTKKDTDNSRIEIFEKDQPRLFEFIRRVCEETQAPFPKKIVVSPHVNASVYYNSSFLSMFLPIRKNLEIGAGLLNCVNLSEFKAVLAHEFGHFSQSSTRLGSYTYRFNTVVYNLLYENDNWVSTLKTLTSWHSAMAMFGQLTIWLVKGVIRFFMAIYKIMNISYLALSREMEFHADSVAVSVSGSKPIISALYRIEFGQEAYNYTLQGIVSYTTENSQYAKNFFSLHQRNIQVIAAQNNVILQQGLPLIDSSLARQQQPESRLQYKDVWASHPSIMEREQNALKIEVDAEILPESPWLLVNDPEKLQEALSLKITELKQPDKKQEVIDNTALLEHFVKKEKEAEVNPVYMDYYLYANNSKTLPLSDDTAYLDQLRGEPVSALFNAGIIKGLKQYYKDMADVETMRQISGGHLNVKHFSFDGKSYTRYYSNEIYEQLKADTEKKLEQLMEQNKKISSWFYARSLQNSPALASEYLELLSFNKRLYDDTAAVSALLQELITYYHERIRHYNSDNDISAHAQKLRDIYGAYKKLEQDSESVHIPPRLAAAGLFEGGYTKTVFSTEVHNPGPGDQLNGLNALHNDLNGLVEKQQALESQTSRQVITLQDEILNS